MINMVLPGVEEVFASPLRPVSILMSDDLPTFERPMNAYSGSVVSGHLLTVLFEILNSADFIIIVLKYCITMKHFCC